MRLVRRLQAVWRRRRLERDLDDEIAFHLAMKEDAFARSGAGDPRHAAVRRFGNAARLREEMRDMWTFPTAESLWADVRFATRRLVRDRSFTAIAVTALALGIGANSTFFALVYATCLRGLPVDDVDRVMVLGSRDADDRAGGLSYAEFTDLVAAPTSFDGLAAMSLSPMTIGDADRAPDRVLGAYISAAGFGVLREPPIAGRTFVADDDRPGAAAVAILGGSVWRGRYGGDTGVVGRTVTVNGTPATIVGVMREGFRFPGTADIWLPLAAMPGLASQPRGARLLQAFGRLADGATPRMADAELTAIRAGWTNDFPDTGRGVRTTVAPINVQYNPSVRQRQWIAFITVGIMVLLIACANVANLLLMRGISRSREMAVRASIGGTRARIVRQLLVEGAVLAACASVAGLALAYAGLRALSTLLPADALPYWMTFTLDYRIVAILAVTNLATVLVFGLTPALHLSKSDPGRTLADGGRGGTRAVMTKRWMASFLAIECALTMVLLAQVVTVAREGLAAASSEFRVEGDDLLTSWLTLPSRSYGTTEARAAFYDRLEERLAADVPEAGIALASHLPGGGGTTQDIAVRGRELPGGEPARTALTIAVNRTYFDVTRIPVRGSRFEAADGRAGLETAIVNERFVRVFLADRTPLGEHIRIGSSPEAPWTRIVGVVPNVRQGSASDPDPVVYLPARFAAPPTMAIVARPIGGDPSALTGPIRSSLVRIDRNLALYRVATLERAMQDARWNPRLAGVLLHSLALIGAILALVGLYAVTGHAVGERRRELAVLAALGARPGELRKAVLRPTMIQLAAGLALGLVCTYWFDRLFNAVNETFSMTDAATLVPLMAAVVVVATAACLVPARQAARIDPIVALRHE